MELLVGVARGGKITHHCTSHTDYITYRLEWINDVFLSAIRL